ncbi:hypothetical protein SNEBB_008899 [Seison nebaliae]|nr:hypothetical protein SNEBB_008899 [Seison nebaliae]
MGGKDHVNSLLLKSTHHGILRIGRSEKKCARTVWMVLNLLGNFLLDNQLRNLIFSQVLSFLGIGLFNEFQPYLSKATLTVTSREYQSTLPMPRIILCYVGKYRQLTRSAKESGKIVNYLKYVDHVLNLKASNFLLEEVATEILLELMMEVVRRMKKKYHEFYRVFCVGTNSTKMVCVNGNHMFNICPDQNMLHYALLLYDMKFNEMNVKLNYNFDHSKLRRNAIENLFLLNYKEWTNLPSNLFRYITREVGEMLEEEGRLFEDDCLKEIMTIPLYILLAEEYSIFYTFFFEVIFTWKKLIPFDGRLEELKGILSQFVSMMLNDEQLFDMSSFRTSFNNYFIILWKFNYFYHGPSIGRLNEKEFKGNLSRVMHLVDRLMIPNEPDDTPSYRYINQLRIELSAFFIFKLDSRSKFHENVEKVYIADEVHPEELECKFNGRKCSKEWKRTGTSPYNTCIEYFFNETHFSPKNEGLELLYDIKTYEMDDINQYILNKKAVQLIVSLPKERVDDREISKSIQIGSRSQVKLELTWYQHATFDENEFPNNQIDNFGLEPSEDSCYRFCNDDVIEELGHCKMKKNFSPIRRDDSFMKEFCVYNINKRDFMVNAIKNFNYSQCHCPPDKFSFYIDYEIETKSYGNQLPETIKEKLRNCTHRDYYGKCLSHEAYRDRYKMEIKYVRRETTSLSETDIHVHRRMWRYSWPTIRHVMFNRHRIN